MSAAGLEIRDLVAGYGATRILDGITLSLPAGGQLAVLGRNGVGKTTLVATLAGQTRWHSGSITLDGHDLVALDSAARARAGLGYVPQHRAVFRSLSVEENLRTGLKDRARDALDEAYALFPRLAERRHNLGVQLSGGEQQMLSIARSLLGQPRLLLLDEPLEGLAPMICQELMAVIAGLAASGRMSVLLIEQRLTAALEFADAVVILERGRIAWQGTPADLAAAPEVIERLLGVAR